MNFTSLNISLAQYAIGLSGAVPARDDWSEPAMDRGILEFVSLLSALVFKYGGRIVHGSHPTFTPIILRQARIHAVGRLRRPITLVMSELWAKDLRQEEIDTFADVAEFIITRKVGDGGIEDPGTRNASLTAMRRVLIEAQNVMVAVGGKLHAADGRIPGVGEEMELAEKKGIPRFLIAGLGGYAAKLAGQLIPVSLGNSLSHADNVALFATNDVGASVNVVFEHLAMSEELTRSTLQPIKWNPGWKAIIDHRDGTVDETSTEFISRAFA